MRIAVHSIPCVRLVLMLTLGTAPLAAQQVRVLPSAPGASIATITEPGYFSEPGLAINPRNPSQAVAVYQTNASAVYSTDAGATWIRAEGTAPPQFRVSGDVSVTYDAHGAAILCFIAFDKLGTTNYWAHNATRNGIFVRRSPDGGKTWEPKLIAVDSVPTARGIPFEDKPYIVADVGSRSRYSGNLYIGWTEFTLDSSVILFSRSTDGGSTWSRPARISTQAGLPRDDNGSVEGFSGAVGPDGTLYVVWGGGNEIMLTTSRDGGKTFAPSRPVIPTAPSYFTVAGVDRSNGFPQIAADPRTGRLFVSWSDYRNGDVDVFVASSSDGAKSWSKAVRVNDDAVHDGTDQYFQWLATDPADGSANVIFYDRRADSANTSARITIARSLDGGRTFTNYALSTTPFDAKGDFIGDYTAIAASNGRVYGAWTEKATTAEIAAVERRTGKKPTRTTIVRLGIADFRRK